MKINHKIKNTIKILFVAVLVVAAVSYRSNRSQQVVPPVYALSGSDTSGEAGTFGTTDTLGTDSLTGSLVDSIPAEPAWMAVEPTDISYRWVKNSDSLRKNLSGTTRKLVLALNRISENRLRRMDSLIVPDTVAYDYMAYSPFPWRMERAADINKIIFFDYRIQAFGAYEHGRLVRWGPVSMGSKSRKTPTGLFHTNYRTKRKVSTVDSEWVMDWYFNIINSEGIAIHEYSLPGYPASHGCLRLLESDARWFYDWADQWRLSADRNKVIAQGTPVVVYGEYPFGSPRPWFDVVQDPKAINVPVASLDGLLDQYLPKVLERQTVRDSVLVARMDEVKKEEVQ